MRIAQVAPLALPVPPRRYGGTERVIYNLTEDLVRRGHEVTLFASGDSTTSARLAPGAPRALWREKRVVDPLAPMFRMHAEVFRRAREFDVIHTHTDWFAFPFARHSPAPVVTTLHGRLDLPHVPELLRAYPEVHLVSISRSQQSQVPQASWAATAHHGLALEKYRYQAAGGEPLAFVGRFSPEKAPHEAIDIALEAGVPLLLAGRVDPQEREYYERELRPRLEHPLVRYVGEVGHREKCKLFGGARALLFPIEWPEPFGLVMLEAMACGTPVIARPLGAAPEVVVDGVTGVLAENRAALVDAVQRVCALDRAACRRHVEENFSVAAMVSRYEGLYQRLSKSARGSHVTAVA